MSLTLKENTISNIFKHVFTIYILLQYLPKRESTLENVQSCPSNDKRELEVHIPLVFTVQRRKKDFSCMQHIGT